MKKKSIYINRRDFLKTGSLAALGGAVMLHTPGYTAQEQKYSFVKNRKKLIKLAEFGRKKPASGKTGICPFIVTKGNKPVLACGSPSVSLMQNIFQNTVNILDFKMSPEKSVNKPRFGGDSIDIPGAALIELDYNEKISQGLEKLGMKLQRISPWNWSMGAFEGIYLDPATGIAYGCGDPRRNSMAMAV